MEMFDEQPAKRLKLSTSFDEMKTQPIHIVTAYHCYHNKDAKSNVAASVKEVVDNNCTSSVSYKVHTMQRILKAVLHSRQCTEICADPCCTPMKGVLNHLLGCSEGKACPVTHCRSTRQIIEHYTNCQQVNCPVCRPVRTESSNCSISPTGKRPPTCSTDVSQGCQLPDDVAKCDRVISDKFKVGELSVSTSASGTSADKTSTNADTKRLTPPPLPSTVQSGVMPPGTVVPFRGGTVAAKKSTIKPARKVYSAEDLQRLLLPSLESMVEFTPHSVPFLNPVDPVFERIPDYPLIIKNPMDLSTIRQKLTSGAYQDPWDYVEDVQLMFSNAWTYNRRSSPFYKSCTKLAEKFESIIDEPMKSLGCCCGQRPIFRPLPLCCFSRQACSIPVYAPYFSFRDKYVFCEKCYIGSRSDVMEVVDDPTQPPILIRKDQFTRAVNMKMEPEPFVQCICCKHRQHQICVRHLDQIWPSGYVCESCLADNQLVRKLNPFTAKKLLSTKLATHLEERVNACLRRHDNSVEEVTIRVLSSCPKLSEVKPRMRQRFPECPAGYPYTAKSIFAFQNVDGVEICFLGLHVQEYGASAAQPNHRRVYLAYLDSVNYFRPKHLRTVVYQEILLGYMDYIKALGYLTVHIWACPPGEGDDYIFHRHPADQKIPKPKRLQDWYRKLLDRAVTEGVVSGYKDIVSDALANGVASPTEIPYFDGDFWPNVLEEAIEEEDKAKGVDDFDDIIEPVSHSAYGANNYHHEKKNQKMKKASKGRKTGSRRGSSHGVFGKLMSTMEKHRETFFTVHLQDMRSSVPTMSRDPDPPLAGELTDGRGMLLMFCRERRLEFSSLRRAKFSTMVMVYELHSEQANGVGKLIHCCRMCSVKVTSCRSCTQCEDYDLCSTCYEKYGHEHNMLQRGFNGGNQFTNGEDTGDLVIQRCIETVAHASQCTLGGACPLQPGCCKMSAVLAHARSCQLHSSCAVCRQLKALCVTHSHRCTLAPGTCPVPFCTELRRHVERRLMIQRRQQQMLVDRRRAVMSGDDTTQLGHVSASDPDDHPHIGSDFSAAGKSGKQSRRSSNDTGTSNTSEAAELIPVSVSNGKMEVKRGRRTSSSNASESMTHSVVLRDFSPDEFFLTPPAEPAANAQSKNFPRKPTTIAPAIGVVKLNVPPTTIASRLPAAEPSTSAREPIPLLRIVVSSSKGPGAGLARVIPNGLPAQLKPTTGTTVTAICHPVVSADTRQLNAATTGAASLRNRMIADCLRVLRRISPHVPQTELMLKLSRCTKRQLDNLHERLVTESQDQTSVSKVTSAANSAMPPASSAEFSALRTQPSGNLSHGTGTYQQLVDIANLLQTTSEPRKPTAQAEPSSVMRNSTDLHTVPTSRAATDLLEQFADNL